MQQQLQILILGGGKMAAKKQDIVEVKSINIERVTMALEGDSPLIVHAWSEKAKREMLEKQMKNAKTA